MAYKNILVHLDDHRDCEQRLQVALAIAKRDKSHLIGLFGFELPSAPAQNLVADAYLEPAVSAERNEYMHARDAAFANAAQFEARFIKDINRAGLTGRWETCPGKPADVIALVIEQARYADLTILGQTDPAHPLFDRLAKLPESVMLASGRPVLIVPCGARVDAVGTNVLVAWNATRESARAVGDAMPMLRSADAVTVVSVAAKYGDDGHDDQLAASLARHLALHDIRAEASDLVSSQIDPDDLILTQAEERGCNLIVMGGYGHSRTREMLLGGVTRGILQHMSVPVLMSH